MSSIISPNQARSRQALERFLIVAAKQLENNVFEETGIAQLAQLAESSVGTFYRLFGDKDVLFHTVHTRLIDRFNNAIDVLAEELRCSDLPFTVQIERFVEGVFRLCKSNEGLLLALIHRSFSDQQYRERIPERNNAYVSQVFCNLALKHLLELGHPQPEQTADFAAHMLLASLGYFAFFGTFGLTPQEIMPKELSRLICSAFEFQRTWPVVSL